MSLLSERIKELEEEIKKPIYAGYGDHPEIAVLKELSALAPKINEIIDRNRFKHYHLIESSQTFIPCDGGKGCFQHKKLKKELTEGVV